MNQIVNKILSATNFLQTTGSDFSRNPAAPDHKKFIDVLSDAWYHSMYIQHLEKNTKYINPDFLTTKQQDWEGDSSIYSKNANFLETGRRVNSSEDNRVTQKTDPKYLSTQTGEDARQTQSDIQQSNDVATNADKSELKPDQQQKLTQLFV